MKVAFVTATYPPSVGGAQSHVHRVASELAARGHRVEVHTTDVMVSPSAPRPGRAGPPREERDGVHVHRHPLARRTQSAIRLADRATLRIKPGPRPSHPFRLGPWGARYLLAGAGAGRRADVVVGCSAPFTSVLLPPFAARSGAAAVATPLLHLGRETIPRPITAALRRCHGITASTDAERDALVALGVEPGRIVLLPPGCDPDRYPDLEPAVARARLGLVERPVVGFLGRLAPYKGIDTFAAAMRRVWVERPDTTMLLAGSPTSWTGFEALAAELADEVGDRLVVRRSFDEDAKALLLSACDVVAFPSREESFGMVTAESWCARRPVVAADIPAVRCVVRPGVDGELVPVGDDAALADHLSALLGDPDRARAMGAAGRARAERDLGWSTIIDGWEDLLDRSVSRRRGGD